ncbi:hypothetical protein [Salisediminibacterium halotolerans]|uniref:hypothetical protein n=1 Tax=Salisediminibacterium halotolerans TaxID=517425 RepID=UPI000EB08916|nr:hypothetical protein [Salisediminibacterium halotolerans]RLJ75524.1 hypothetical protein BCL39_1040 [Actinophytocola xinjiangensis]RPE89377.1 hypothetical protein EDD67_0153 [Salisediminibacterium halotolerans]TWG36137.1 hypothetical protein BCL52_1038 [Salisediminibacterium halotolerans]GEL08139.1 hypothetical protein SHA02_15550 [Salisediminibacterium halotolerans]
MASHAARNEPRWAEPLQDEEVQASMAYLLRKLPEIEAAVESIDQFVQFGQQTFQDRTSMDHVEDQLSLSSIDQESIEALGQLIGKMPVLLKLTEQVEQAATFAESVMNDQESLAYIADVAEESTVMKKGKELWNKADQIQEIAEENKNEQISIFTVMKWIKDPSVQQGLRYTKAALQVMNQK